MRRWLRLYYRRGRRYLYSRSSTIFSHTFHVGHTCYFCAVFIEAKGTYGLIAGGLFFMSLIALYMHFDLE